MKFGVVIFPGSNCDHDMIYMLSEILNKEVVELWHKQTSLDGFDTGDCVVIPGGFSYGDYLRSGAIARFSPIMQAVTAFAKEGGHVVGICNGFQILCEAHLLPGVLLRNANQKFICKNIFIKPMTVNTAITGELDQDRAYQIPIAHAEGRFHCDQTTFNRLVEMDQILFKYCDEVGSLNDTANPNGSLDNIAGICNEDRNVIGMMPHPERAADPALLNTDGRFLFESLITRIESTSRSYILKSC
ncbi:MAG: phosphoribosylformylglycinamidine synthase subunit PurQ [Saprospiraceae bacterium]|nr:phosphoribosylformylglycinamidine synthase subunit PurQ [Saprospiraceae bacterium]